MTVNLDVGLTGACGDPIHVNPFFSSMAFSRSRGIGVDAKERGSSVLVSPTWPTGTEGAVPTA